MEVKKTTKADLNKRTVLFLQIGLIVVLLMAYFVVQWRSYENSEIVQAQPLDNSVEELEIPITNLPTPPPPKLPVAPDEIKLIPDDEDIEVVGASSDMLILNLGSSEKDYKVGDLISFKLKYMGALAIMNSNYIEKRLIN